MGNSLSLGCNVSSSLTSADEGAGAGQLPLARRVPGSHGRI